MYISLCRQQRRWCSPKFSQFDFWKKGWSVWGAGEPYSCSSENPTTLACPELQRSDAKTVKDRHCHAFQKRKALWWRLMDSLRHFYQTEGTRENFPIQYHFLPSFLPLFLSSRPFFSFLFLKVKLIRPRAQIIRCFVDWPCLQALWCSQEGQSEGDKDQRTKLKKTWNIDLWAAILVQSTSKGAGWSCLSIFGIPIHLSVLSWKKIKKKMPPNSWKKYTFKKMPCYLFLVRFYFFKSTEQWQILTVGWGNNCGVDITHSESTSLVNIHM